VGLGPLENDLRTLVATRGLDDVVRFTGSRDDVFEILPAFDVFVLSSRHEGLPIALMEAMASGVACVATRVGGVPELIDDGRNGLLVDPGDPSALAAAIAKLLDDESLRRALATSARTAAATMTLAPAATRLQEVYDTLAEAA
jgi:glycosyltransferase involved in cell wall biosynthesis